MPTFVALPLYFALIAYCSWYWLGLTRVMIADARYNRMKDEIDWERPRSRRPQSKSLRLGRPQSRSLRMN